jgi:hypothetical protein
MCDCKKTSKTDFKELLNPSNCYTSCSDCKEKKHCNKKKCTDCTNVITYTNPTFSCTVPIAVRAQICKNGAYALQCITNIYPAILIALAKNDYPPLFNLVCANTVLTIFLADGTVLFRSITGLVPPALIQATIAALGSAGNVLTFIDNDGQTGTTSLGVNTTTDVSTSSTSTTETISTLKTYIVITVSPV